MQIASIKDLNPVNYGEEFPNISFPIDGPSDDFLAEQGYAKVNVFREHDRATQKLIAVDPYYEAPWVYTVAVVDLSTEDLAQRDAVEASRIRAERNTKLAASDWTQVIDAPVDQAAWATYRQALRDITSQAGFPWDIQWPAQP